MPRYFNRLTEKLLKKPRDNDSELDKLEAFLIEHDISYERRTIRKGEFTVQNIIFVPSFDNRKWDASCQFGTYGYEEGLLEVYGTITKSMINKSFNDWGDDVVGWRTAEEVIKHIDISNPEE